MLEREQQELQNLNAYLRSVKLQVADARAYENTCLNTKHYTCLYHIHETSGGQINQVQDQDSPFIICVEERRFPRIPAFHFC
jgi:hypothetical protein